MNNPDKFGQFRDSLSAANKTLDVNQAIREGLKDDNQLSAEDKEKKEVQTAIIKIKDYWDPKVHQGTENKEKKAAVIAAIKSTAAFYQLDANEVFQWVYGENLDISDAESPETFAMDQIKDLIAATGNEKLKQLIDPNNNVNLDNIAKQLKRTSSPTAITQIHPNWFEYSEEEGLGDRQCARYISELLGLKTKPEGHERLVSILLARLMKGLKESPPHRPLRQQKGCRHPHKIPQQSHPRKNNRQPRPCQSKQTPRHLRLPLKRTRKPR